jgi:hypothetical protein
MNDELEDMMDKSKNDKVKDGLDTLRYSKQNERLLPLYTWVLAELPPAPPKPTKSWLSRAGGSIFGGFSYVASGVAKQIAAKAQAVAYANDEEGEKTKNHVY